jgi:hypothetical protein
MAKKRHTARNPKPPPPHRPNKGQKAPHRRRAVATGGQTRDTSAKNRNLSPEFVKRIWKPGQSGNPNGRPQKLTRELDKQLSARVPGDPKKRSYAQLFIESVMKRAITKSDVLAKEIFDRIEGKIPQIGEESTTTVGVKVVILDLPRPQRTSAITVASPNGDESKS